MTTNLKNLNPIHPNPPRWEPHADPSLIEVPGLDTSASVNDQIDQIEHLITVKLQNTDANFSRIQHILSTRILPAFKRYSVGTEPVREAAKFWTSFYEQAAQIRLPTYDDYPFVQEQQPEDDTNSSAVASESASASTHDSTSFDPSRTPSDSSFLPGQAAISSTPATASRHRAQNSHDTFTTQNSDPSWNPSLESPLVRLDRDLQDFARDEQQPVSESVADVSQGYNDSDTAEMTIHAQVNSEHYIEPRFPSPDKGKSRQRTDLLRLAVDPQLSMRPGVSPLRFKQKPKTPIAASRNPYLPPGTQPSEWSGVVDLRDPSAMTPRRSQFAARSTTPIASSSAANNQFHEYYDDGDDLDLPPGMSPPVMMEFARLPKLGRTPSKEAAARIGRDLIGNAQRFVQPNLHIGQGGTESSLSSATPPSLSKYMRSSDDSVSSSAVDSTLESMMNRIGSNVPGGYRASTSREQTASSSLEEYVPTSSLSGAGYAPARTPFMGPTALSVEGLAHLHPSALQTPDQQRYDVLHMQDDSMLEPTMPQDSDSSMDSMDSMEDEIHDTAHPSAAFLLASQQRGRNDDEDSSFGSDDTDGDDLDDGGEPIHPFARAAAGIDDGFDDSFEDDEPEEETVFGMRPAERAARASEAATSGGAFVVHGVEPVQDTIGIAERLDILGKSPTPWAGQGGGSLG
ncbi:hypothetical protein EW146_g10216 [Bondarzewia mesenterica]|uniref:DASH complex subunit ASK1 n=1 Tax=Bondarzewia mesenterica TaxID=1095465 RepID=A0A4S4L422_9AGAM|nr:hypothetical protein EW146_g10216 [Bondarzewia mesenterica]